MHNSPTPNTTANTPANPAAKPSRYAIFGRWAGLVAASTLALAGSITSVAPASAMAATTSESDIAAAINPAISRPQSVIAAPSGRYIVVLTGQPTVTYSGNVSGLPRTKPTQGKKLNATDAGVRKYETHLKSAQASIAQEKGVKVSKNYTTALNGFVTTLDAHKANELAQDPRVLMVVPDTPVAPDANSTDFLGLSGKTGVWNAQFSAAKNAGTGTVIGILDSGFYPQSPYFKAPKPKALPPGKNPVVGVPYLKSPGVIAMLKADGNTFEGLCQAGEDFAATSCNSKVISARYFDSEFSRNYTAAERGAAERISPIDITSHGTHVASTAAGNAVASSTPMGIERGRTVGVAPGAKLAVYKICWQSKFGDGCYPSAAIEAINQAVIDGVDVLNYSISGSGKTTTDPVSLAFLSAVSAGVFVSASAGNSGNTAGTVAHGAPWLTTVAASTYTNAFSGTVLLSDGTKYRGSSQNGTPLPQTATVLARESAVAGARSPSLCLADSLDAAKVAGKVVVCERGQNLRLAKSAEVKRAGGVGMILVNVAAASLDADAHTVPSIHLDVAEGTAFLAQLAKQPTLTAAFETTDTTGLPPLALPQVSFFSSRGPLSAGLGDLLKPDITAPGSNVVAGVSPINNGGEVFGVKSGTSMSSPHIAGLGALLLAKNPTWNASEVKSAMMTTAQPTLNSDGTPATDRFAMGAGQVQPASMFTPGLLVAATDSDYLNFIAGQGVKLSIEGVTPVPARDMNLPSIAVGSMRGSATITRTFTAAEPGVFKVSSSIPGVSVTATPNLVSFSRVGEQRKVTFTLTTTTAPLDQYVFGTITLEGKGKRVNLPVAVKPTPDIW